MIYSRPKPQGLTGTGKTFTYGVIAVSLRPLVKIVHISDEKYIAFFHSDVLPFKVIALILKQFFYAVGSVAGAFSSLGVSQYML